MSQVNFFMTAADEAEFLSLVLAEPSAGWLEGRFHKTRSPTVARVAPSFGGDHTLVLVNEKIRSPTLLSADGGGDYIGQHCPDIRDPHIDLNRSYFLDGVLHPGRIYAKIGWCPTASENKALHRWYGALARWIKRRYVKADNLYWLGPDAGAWLRGGGRTLPDIRSRGLSTAG